MNPRTPNREKVEHMKPTPEDENRQLRKACAAARALLGGAAEELRELLEDEPIIQETPLEAQAVMETAVEVIGAALRRLDSVCPAHKPAVHL